MRERTLTLPTRNTPTRDQLARDTFLNRYDAGTRKLYEGDLRIFFDWCAREGLAPLDARRPDLERFTDYLLKERGNLPVSARRRMQALKSFYALAVDDELLDRDPTRLLRLPRRERNIDRLVWLDRFEVGAMLRTAEQISPDHHALIGLMAMGGLRVTAACVAQLQNVTPSTGQAWRLTVLEKGRRIHTAPVPPELLDIIETARDGRTTGPIIRKRNGRPQDRHGAYAWVQIIANRAGIPHATPHSFRRAAISTLLDAGASMEQAREFAGHAQTSTTEGYDRTGGARGVHGTFVVANAFAAVA